jgi:ADP-ribose pyrophosphatase YjhB (NUDIX family)
VTLRLRSAVRALIVDEFDATLLVKFVFPSGTEAWALPGGGLEEGETAEVGLRRELNEELGLTEVPIGPHIWSREHIIPMSTGHDGQRDRIHLVRMPRFEPEPLIGWDRMRAEFVFEMKWWSLDEILSSSDIRFAPRRLGELYEELLVGGPPVVPLDTGV